MFTLFVVIISIHGSAQDIKKNMSEQDKRNIEIVKHFYQSQKEFADSNIIWHVPGHNPVSATYNGSEEFFNLMPSRMAPLSQWEFEVNSVMVNGDYVLAVVRVKVNAKGKKLTLQALTCFG